MTTEEQSAGERQEEKPDGKPVVSVRRWADLGVGVRFGAAVLAVVCGLLAGLGARYFFGIVTPAELFGDRLTALVPLPLFERLLATFGSNAKHLYFGAVVVGEGVLTALVGTLYWPLRGRLFARLGRAVHPAPSLLDAVVLTGVLWLLAAGLFAPLIGGGLFGVALLGGAGTVFISTLIPDAVFALVLIRLVERPAPAPTAANATAGDDQRIARRTLLRQTGIAVAVLGGGVVLWQTLSSAVSNLIGLPAASGPQLHLGNVPSKIIPPPVPQYGPWTAVRGQTPEVTAERSFYYVSKNLAGDPQVDRASWRLEIGGLVDAPYALSYEQLSALPAVERYHTLECISNEVGGDLMSNGLFTGVALADVLNHAGIRPGASELIFRAADGYSDSLHLSQAIDARSLIVYLLNGEPLAQAHGFPARLLIPGLYGMKNGKWLTSLQLGSGGYTGYWEQRGWTREARIKMTARLDTPHDGDLLLARPTFIAGVAYSGAGGIAQVDVSLDGGQTWQPANLKRPLGSLTWVLWEYPWQPTSGQYVIAARAIDLDGNVQSPATASPLPDGASGYDAISVTVR
ncbi:MAG TPA: molybdopterin-dependent oxidoreductase [Ktedonobacterales bacterium]|nr:molybdopterin-dependent oxidoreductase [Ktedonobacterales bacterium]